MNESLEKIKETEKEEDDDDISSFAKENKKLNLINNENIASLLLKDIGFIKRTNLTNTHRNIVDDHIESLSTWKVNKFKKLLTIVGYFLSFGILFIITLYDKTIILKLYCERANPEESHYVLISDYDNKKYLVKLIKEKLTSINSLFKMFKMESKTFNIPSNSRYINKNNLEEEQNNDMLNLYFIFKNVRYIYHRDSSFFSSAYFNLNNYKHSEILRLFDRNHNFNLNKKNKEITLQEEENENVYYPSLQEYNYLINKYGLNQIVNETTKLSNIILQQFFTGFNFFCIICEIIWFIIGYHIFAVIIFLLSLIVLIKSTIDSYYLNKRIYELDKDNSSHNDNNNDTQKNNLNITSNELTSENNIYSKNTLMKQNEENENQNNYIETSIRQINPELKDYINNIEQNWSIVPGEIIKIKPGHKISFDGVILNGYCTVDESELTGETNEIYKTQIPNDDEYFQYNNSKNHFLFQGTIIRQCTNDNNNDIIRVLVINTGMNTNRANLLLNLSFPKQENYSLYKDTLIFMLIMLIMFIFAIIFNIKIKCGASYYFSDVTIILSPILIISLSISSTFYKSYLEKKGVHCVDKNKIIVAGKSNVIALDKTGTLTENEFDLYGYQFTMPEEYSNNIDNNDVDAKNVNRKMSISNFTPRKSFNLSNIGRESDFNNIRENIGNINLFINKEINNINTKSSNKTEKNKSNIIKSS